MTNYKVFCADCKMRYEQSGHKPVVCGVCGSDFIAVKAISVADDMALDEEHVAGYAADGSAVVLM